MKQVLRITLVFILAVLVVIGFGKSYMSTVEAKREIYKGSQFSNRMEELVDEFELASKEVEESIQDIDTSGIEETIKDIEAEIESENWGEDFGNKMSDWGVSFGDDMSEFGISLGESFEELFTD